MIFYNLLITAIVIGIAGFLFYRILFNKEERERERIYKFCDKMYDRISLIEIKEKDEVKKACYSAMKNKYINMMDTGDDIMESCKLLELPDSTLIYLEAELQNYHLKKEFYTESKIKELYSEALSEVKKIEEEVSKK